MYTPETCLCCRPAADLLLRLAAPVCIHVYACTRQRARACVIAGEQSYKQTRKKKQAFSSEVQTNRPGWRHRWCGVRKKKSISILFGGASSTKDCVSFLFV